MVKEKYIPVIKQVAKELRNKYKLGEQAVIGDYIFTILQDDCVLMQWPENEQLDLDGFSTEKIIDGRAVTLVYINSAKNVEKQNFCAAHELGHRYRVERLLKDAFPDDVFTAACVEDIMNRFAAELLLPAEDFVKRVWEMIKTRAESVSQEVYSLSVRMVLDIIIDLMNYYYVPYKATLYRMVETGIISSATCARMEKYETERKDVVDKMIQTKTTRLRTPNEKIQVSVPVPEIEECINRQDIMRYMTKKQLKHYLLSLGATERDVELAVELQEIEEETICMHTNETAGK